MKKTAVIIVSLFLAFSGFSQSSLPNGNFEGWTQSPHGFWEPDGGFFKTLNILDTIPTPPGITAYPCDTAHGGSKSAGLITREILLGPVHILIPGVIGNLRINWFTQNATLGAPYIWPTKAQRFQGFYMADPLNGDSTGAIILLSKWNGITHQRDTIAYTRLIFQGIINTWTEFDVPINYWDNTTMPDSITILLLSCGGYNAENMMASVGQVGSRAFFDDVTLTNIAGIEILLMPDVEVKLSPNPASDYLTVTLDKPVSGGVFEIYTVLGKLLQRHSLSGVSVQISVGELPGGSYYYKLTDGRKLLNSGSFIVKN